MSNINMFGKSYGQVGDLLSNLLLKTRGDIKILLGNRFISLLKDGKINVDSKFIFNEGSVGTKDGIYVVGEDIILKVGGEEIPLKTGDIGNVYVSFFEALETTSDMKYQALLNIGFLYNSLDDISEDAIKNGIVYIELQKQLYIINNGEIFPYSFELPNPLTKQFVIQKNSSDKGALVIRGSGIENSIAFDSFYIYDSDNGSILEADETLLFRISNEDIIEVTNKKVTCKVPLESNKFQSVNFSDERGFKLSMDGDKSSLIIDSLTVRDGLDNLEITLYPEYWLGSNNIIKNIDFVVEEVEEVEEVEGENYNNFTIYLNQINNFSVGDILVVYLQIEEYSEEEDEDEEEEEEEEEDNISISKILFKVIESSNNNITVEASLNILNPSDLVNSFIFKIKSLDDNFYPIRIKGNSIDVVRYKLTDQWYNLEEEILSKFTDGTILAKEAKYLDNYELSVDDNSKNFASTEWVVKKIGDYNELLDRINLLESDNLNLRELVDKLVERLDICCPE